MKKSNSLMFSYVIFLIIALGANIFFKWDGLERIAMAAGIAGCFFAFSDLIGWYISYKTICLEKLRTTNNYITEAFEAELDTIEEQNEEIQNTLDAMHPYLDKSPQLCSMKEDVMQLFQNNLVSKKNFEEAVEEGYESNESIIKEESVLKTWKKIEFTFMTIGFVLLLVIVSFEDLVTILTPYQTIIAIIAFAIIILNYFLKDCIEEIMKQKLDKLQKDAEDAKSTVQKMNEDFSNLKLLESINSFIQKIKDDEIQN